MMSSENTGTKQSPEELADETLKSMAGGNQNSSTSGLIDPNPPTEVPSPSSYKLDPDSAKQPS